MSNEIENPTLADIGRLLIEAHETGRQIQRQWRMNPGAVWSEWQSAANNIGVVTVHANSECYRYRITPKVTYYRVWSNNNGSAFVAVSNNRFPPFEDWPGGYTRAGREKGMHLFDHEVTEE